MNYKMDLTLENQKLLENANIKIENKNYTIEEIKRDISNIGDYIISKSSKNGDIAKAEEEYTELVDILQKSV